MNVKIGQYVFDQKLVISKESSKTSFIQIVLQATKSLTTTSTIVKVL